MLLCQGCIVVGTRGDQPVRFASSHPGFSLRATLCPARPARQAVRKVPQPLPRFTLWLPGSRRRVPQTGPTVRLLSSELGGDSRRSPTFPAAPGPRGAEAPRVVRPRSRALLRVSQIRLGVSWSPHPSRPPRLPVPSGRLLAVLHARCPPPPPMSLPTPHAHSVASLRGGPVRRSRWGFWGCSPPAVAGQAPPQGRLSLQRCPWNLWGLGDSVRPQCLAGSSL